MNRTNNQSNPPIFSICLNDGGRSKSRRPRQRNCCTVICTAIAFNMSYDAAFDLLQIHGRQNNKGIRYYDFLRQYPESARKISANGRIDADYLSIAQWLPRLESGKFVVMIDCHVFAVINGVIHDTVPVDWNSKVYHVYQVLGDIQYDSFLEDALQFNHAI